jgi:hypothetical protein
MLLITFRETVLLLLIGTLTFVAPFSTMEPIRPTMPALLPPTTDNLSVDEIYELVDAKGKHASPVPVATVAALVLLGVPTFFVVLPFSILYQVCMSIVETTVDKTKDLAPIDSGIQVSSEDIIPIQERKYDLVLIGATGFTGSLGVRYLAKTYGVNKDVKWAIAGRSQSKLDDVKKRWAKELGNDDILKVDTIIVDTS